MTVEEIDSLFQEAIKERGVHNKLGVTKDVVYNYRKGRGNLSFGDKLEVLYKLKAIIILMPIRGKEDAFHVSPPEFPKDRKDFTKKAISEQIDFPSKEIINVSLLQGKVGDEFIVSKNGEIIKVPPLSDDQFKAVRNQFIGNYPIPIQPIELPEGFEEIKTDWLNHMK